MLRRFDWPHFVLFCTSLLGAGCAYAAREVPPVMGLMSLPALLAGVAGGGLVLSFLPPRADSNFKIFGTIVFCGILASLLAPASVRIAVGYVAAFAGPTAEVAAAFVVGAIGQVLIPMLIERKGDLLGLFLSKKKEGS
jgi:hypothetical protein